MRFRIAREFFSAAVKALSLLVLLLTLLLLPQCAWEMPGCSEGEIDRNPLESNLIEYTVPATGHIKRKSEFNILQVVFLVYL